MFEDFLNHKCDIYHLTAKTVIANYGVKVTPTYDIPDKADEVNVPCHFHTKSNGLSIVQSVPFRELDGYVKLTLAADTDIRMNDIVRDRETGLYYKAGKPITIHGNHHIIVDLNREEGVKGAI